MTGGKYPKLKHLTAISLLAFVPWKTATATPGSSFRNLATLESQGARVSAIALDLQSGKIIAEMNGDKRLTPASVTKVVLGAAALETWGANHTFRTRIHGDGVRNGNRLQGDLVLLGAGDPYLTNEKLWFLATDVARTGIKTVSGDLVINVSLFGPIKLDANRKAGKNRSSHAYDSPLSAAAVNFSVLAAVASAGERVGAPANLALEPYPLESTKLTGEVRTVSPGQPYRVQASRTNRSNVDIIQASGTIALDALPTRVYRSVSDADEYAGDVLRAFLTHAGVTVLGKTRVERVPISKKTFPIAEVEGFPLDWQLQGLFKVSNNFIGDMLTIDLDAAVQKEGGATLEGGARLLEKYLALTLAETTLPKPEAPRNNPPPALDSGSGLTPENRLSAFDVTAILHRMYNNTREFPAFLSALPIPGAEGTVRRRFSEPGEKHLRDSLRAKTGTLSEPIDAVGLAGYARRSNGAWVAFTVIVNGSEQKPGIGIERVRDAIDADLALLFPKEN